MFDQVAEWPTIDGRELFAVNEESKGDVLARQTLDLARRTYDEMVVDTVLEVLERAYEVMNDADHAAANVADAFITEVVRAAIRGARLCDD